MSTIVPSLQPASGQLPGAVQPAAETIAPATQQSYTPLWLIGSTTSQNAFQHLGIRTPNAPGDIAALLSRVSLTLELTMEEGRKQNTLASLASLAAALSAFGLEAKREAAENEREARDTSAKSLADVREKTDPLVSARNTENARIDTFKGQISQLEARLADPTVVGAERTQLQAQLSTARDGLSTALASRETIDIKLANARIESLEQQVSDAEAMLKKMKPGSSKAEEQEALLASLRNQLAAAQSQRSTFIDGPKTEAIRNSFSNSNAAALQSATSALATRVDQHKQSFATEIRELEEMTLQAAAVAANLTAAYQANRQQQDVDEAGHDKAIDQIFESLTRELGVVGEKANAALEATRLRLADLKDEHRSRNIAQSALALLGALATIVGVMSGIDTDAPTVPTVANRFRIDI
ncbi:hypothetical protein [Mesorhizobium sp. ANAO-SY3R2]|uniref:hypothetical protein n=1 Tax=Mesorhizobium sp. ANAO-SY3R2 TaxID=3166644 RepID=UPI0036710B59